MYIPKQLKTHRFYVAVRETKALSSWSSLAKALACIDRFKEHAPYEFTTIKGVIKVSPNGREWVKTPEVIEMLNS